MDKLRPAILKKFKDNNIIMLLFLNFFENAGLNSGLIFSSDIYKDFYLFLLRYIFIFLQILKIFINIFKMSEEEINKYINEFEEEIKLKYKE
jgi:hypothetical protein